MVLFAYLVSHFLNHALGNISMEALASGVYWHTLFWHSLPVTLVFYAACLVHTGLGIWALYERRQFRWKAIEPLQLVLGLSIPAMIITHVIGVRLGYSLYGHEILYPQVFFAYWISWPPLKMWMLFAVLVISWTHGCIGLYFWLRMKPFYKTAAPYLLAIAVLIPTRRHARPLSGRTHRRRQRQRRMAGGESQTIPDRHIGRKGRAERRHGLSPDRLLGPARHCPAGKRRARHP